jgi:hypothetical protein
MELLILAKDGEKSADPLAWGKGHVVAIKPDGWKWGSRECPPTFQIVRVDAKEADLKIYEEPDERLLSVLDQRPILVSLRKYKLDEKDASLDVATKEALTSIDKAPTVLSKATLDTIMKPVSVAVDVKNG